jgi:hypothetical protein
MNKLRWMALLLLLAPGAARADEVPAGEDPDVYYAPEEVSETAAVLGGSAGSVAASPSAGASSMSHARLIPFAWGEPDKPLKGAELFLNGQYLGHSPLSLDSVLVSLKPMTLTAHLDGYEEAVRPAVIVPAEGELRVALLGEDAASWYTTPAWIVGLGMVAGSLAAYNNGNGTVGIALVGGGVAIITLTQLSARLFHLPSLRRDVEAYNQRPQP